MLVVLATLGCQNQENFQHTASSEVFVQEFNPNHLEILWVIDDRSPMRNYRDELIAEAKDLFERLDTALGEFGQYRMAITNTDARVGKKGKLFPKDAPVVLTRGMGTLQQRLDFFGGIFPEMLNLQTDSINRGFEASIAALTQAPFSSDPRIPLVLIYLSYGDDDSALPSAQTDVIEAYAQQLLALKNGDAGKVRVYAANYLPLGPGVPPSAATRCALQNGNEIDVSPATYEDRYFRLAQRMGGDSVDLCAAGFAQALNLTGIQLLTLPKRFALMGFPDPTKIQVTITKNGSIVTGFTWHYEIATREIVFDDTPPQGSRITVIYE